MGAMSQQSPRTRIPRMKRPRNGFLLSLWLVSLQWTRSATAFVVPTMPRTPTRTTTSTTPTALNVWWYGGNDNEPHTSTDSCELVAVRIERTSSNSRRIFGDITIAAPIQDVWSILTDYNRLTTHVPNLVESRVEQNLSPGQPGDGQFQCRLYQKGAQKIVGFEFGASVAMHMQERVSSPEQREIRFDCVDSFFFSEFDGAWTLRGVSDNETVLSYMVDVRPKGPVPVAALEWRIREDVPTNLRAVKEASLKRLRNELSPVQLTTPTSNGRRLPVQWAADETMETYLKK